MFGIQPLIDITALTLQSAYVGDLDDPYRPSSLLFVARPESGKTSTIDIFSEKYPKMIYYANEITTKILVDQVLPKLQTKEKRFIMIPDILNCTEKQSSTKAPFLQTLKSLTEEGIRNIQTPFKNYSFDKPVIGGLITAITRMGLYEKTTGRRSLFDDLRSMGFLSRMIPFSFDYPIDMLHKIFRFIISNESKPNYKIPDLRTPKESVMFEKAENLFPQLEKISTALGRVTDSYGIRVQKNLHRLCYANAYINKRETVTQADIDKIFELAKWINFDFNPL